MSEPTLRFDATPPVATLELDHGKANEMGRAQLDEIDAITRRLSKDDEIRALISFSRRRNAKGTPLFISGANVTERQGWGRDTVAAHVRYQRQVLGRLRQAPVFHVAVINGVALGWGTEFLITCDYRIAVREATFGLPETGLGIVPGAGGSSELFALIGVPQALRLGMTGERIDAAEALRIGLVQEVVPLRELLATAKARALAIAEHPPLAVRLTKRAAYQSWNRDLAVALELAATYQGIAQNQPDHLRALGL